MKSILKFKHSEFPKLMISRKTGLIVLFSSKKTGTVIFADRYNDVGHHSTVWNPNIFEDLNGNKKIILSNK